MPTLFAQQTQDPVHLSNIQQLKLKVSDTISIEQLNILEWQTIQIENTEYIIDTINKYLIFKSFPETDSITLKYRKSPITFNKLLQRKSLTQIDSNIALGPGLTYNADATAMKGYVKFNALEYNGSYARSLQVGNSQDVTLNSNFNINLNGYILDSVRVEAAITDNTIPFQTDGNTYQLQEFDKLYITFEKNKHKLTAGDFNMLQPVDNYFLKYNKRVQGLNFSSGFDISDKVSNQINFSGSIAKGQFARNTFFGKEGNQGPYKLVGNNGEVAFVVLAGTEKVYIDGQLLQRGQDRDYIINYNTAEVTFMPKQMITKDKRIQIEFEYQDRNYLNSLFHINDQLQLGEKLKLNFNVYSNQDARNQPYLQTLGPDEKAFLGSIGDDINRAFYRTNVVDTFKEKEVLYRITSVDINGVLYDTVYEYSTNNDSTLYRLSFTNMGQGKGNYVVSDAAVNGRIYKWVAPVDGLPQGSYEPVLLLITPKKHQLFSLGMVYDIDSSNQVKFEGAASNFDPNLFANNSSDAHWGNAFRMDYQNKTSLRKSADSANVFNPTWKNQVYIERVSSNFRAIAPYRNIEFARDWNIDTAKKANDLLLGYKSGVQIAQKWNVHYDFDYYSRTNQINGHRHILGTQYTYKGFTVKALGNVTFSSNVNTLNRFWRPNLTIEQQIKPLNNALLGVNYAKEQRIVTYKSTGILSDSSFNFDIITFYLRNGAHAKNKYDINYRIRLDDSVYQYNTLQQGNTAQELNANLSIFQLKNQVINITGTYRNLLVQQSRGDMKSSNAVVSRVEHNGAFLKKMITTSTIYEVGTGQEQKREYTYIEVDAGLGTHMWIDYNDDGVQQVNEFEIAIYDDQKRYIRVINPTNEYVNVNYMSLNHSLQLQPDNLWRNTSNSTLKFINRFSDQLSVQLNNRAYQEEGLAVYNPFNTGGLNEENVIAANASITNVVFFNRINPKFGIDYTTQRFIGKMLLTYGIEESEQLRHLMKGRIGIAKAWTFNLNLLNADKSYRSGLVDDRSYDIQMLAAEPMLTWLVQSKFRISALYKIEQRQNAIIYGGELAKIHNLGMETKWSLRKSGTINMRFTYAQIDYNGLPNTPKTFAILESLKNGNNWIWFTTWDMRLGKNMELSINYEGRKTGTDRVIHTGNMSIRALLN